MKRVELVEKNFMMIMFYSIIGWIYEELWYLLVPKKLVNRGFMYGPYLPVYGLGLIIIYHCLWKFRHKRHEVKNIDITPLFIFIAIFFIASVVEYISHYLLDALFHIKLWDYSKKAFNINGRVCLSNSLCFAAGGTIALYFVQPVVEKINKNFKGSKRHLINASIGLIVAVDIIFTLIKRVNK